jgi:molecular chaperone DnaJ
LPNTTDHYEVLGVSRDASADDIKKAFRGRARDVHPDTSDHEDAEERFKRLNEAYEVLSDPEKRAMYDRFGTADPRQAGYGAGNVGDFFGGGSGMEDLFSVFFDGMTGGAGRAVRREGRDMAAQVVVTLLQAADGTTTQVRYTRTAPCSECAGSGAGPGGEAKTCPDCQGSGQVSTVRPRYSARSSRCTHASAAARRARSSIPRVRCAEAREGPPGARPWTWSFPPGSRTGHG